MCYQHFLFFLRHGAQGIYPLEDALATLKKLVPAKEKVDKEKALKELETVKKQTKRLEKVLTHG